MEKLAKIEYAAAIDSKPELLPDPVTAVSGDLDSLIRALQDTVTRGDGRRLHENPVAGDLLEAIDNARLDELAPSVVDADGRLRPLEPTTTWIAPSPEVGAVATAYAHRVLPVGPDGAVGVVLTSQIVLTCAAAVRGRRSAKGATIKLPAGTGLALLEFAADIEEAFADIEPPAVAEPHHGMAIVALGTGRGSPAINWGVMMRTGGQFAVVCDGGHPARGAPLFDLDGRLVAIHDVAGLAHPAADLETLLRGLATDTDTPLGASTAGDPHVADRPGGDTPTQTASEFLAAIVSTDLRALAPAYWAAPTEANVVDRTLPSAIALTGDTADIRHLCGGAHFMRPLLVTVHCAELTPVVAPAALAAFA